MAEYVYFSNLITDLYGNILLFNKPQSVTNRLHLVQNNAARLGTRTRQREHITPILFQLHRIPVFQISVQYPDSYIQCIEWNTTIVSNPSDQKNIYQ